MWKFIYYYIRSMRLYYGLVSGSAAVTGAVVYHATSGTDPGWRTGCVLAIAYLAWGVNQIFNDWSNLPEDRINAPHRPLVTGALALRPALVLSSALMVIFGAVAIFVSVWCLIPMAAGCVFNLLYGKAKRFPIAGSAVYALSLSQCTVFGFIGSAGGPVNPGGCAWLLVPLFLSHMLMCLYSGFKDEKGDAAAGKRTLQVACGEERARWITGIFSMLLMVLYFALVRYAWPPSLYPGGWVLCTGMAWLNIRAFRKGRMHEGTETNCQSCALQQLLPGLLFAPEVILLMVVTWFAIHGLFWWYTDEKE